MVIIHIGDDACKRCLGWKQIADSENGESWKLWAELPVPSNLAVVIGLVKPIACPRCYGSGREPGKDFPPC